MVGVERAKDAAIIDLDRIVPDPNQPRKEFDEEKLRETERSLLDNGQLQPIRVRWDEGLGKYMILMGERRYRAAKNLGLKSLSAVVHEGPLSPAEVLEIQLIENTVRDDLKPIELATSIRRLMDEFGYTQADVGRKLKMSQPAVAQSLALLKLDPEVRAKVEGGSISKKSALQIAKVALPEAQREIAARVEAGGLTEGQTAEVVRESAAKRPRPKAPKGRGGAKPRKPARQVSKVHNHAGIKIEARRGRGFELPELRQAVAGFLERIDAELAVVA
jgi:ParB family chromosome partitioning protein